eukprot:2158583-Amphidinium_carterae.1
MDVLHVARKKSSQWWWGWCENRSTRRFVRHKVRLMMCSSPLSVVTLKMCTALWEPHPLASYPIWVLLFWGVRKVAGQSVNPCGWWMSRASVLGRVPSCCSGGRVADCVEISNVLWLS